MRSLKKLVSICMLSLILVVCTFTTTFASDERWLLDILHEDYKVEYNDCKWEDGPNGGTLTIMKSDTDALTKMDWGFETIDMSEFYCSYDHNSCMTTKTLVRRVLIRHKLIRE